MAPVYINGKFLSQRLTGVQRFAREIIRAVDLLADDPDFSFLRGRLVLVVPGGVDTSSLAYKNIAVVRAGNAASHVWEQSVLPWFTRGRPLINLSGSAPLCKLDQVVTFHDAAVFDTPESYSLPFRLWYRFAFTLGSRLARRVLTISSFSRDRLSQRLGLSQDRFAIVPNGCDHMERISPDPQILARLGLECGSYLLAVGSNNPSKNFAGLIDAYASMPNSIAPLLVTVGGTNSSVFSSGSMINDQRIIKAGPVTDGELKALYSNAMAFVFPSLYEGFGIPPLEAMICGTPVAASSAASITEVCGDAALYFDPRDKQSIAKALTRIAGDSALRQSLTALGASRAELFTWDGAARILVGLLVRDGLLGRRAA